jgi:hypothetical protein
MLLIPQLRSRWWQQEAVRALQQAKDVVAGQGFLFAMSIRPNRERSSQRQPSLRYAHARAHMKS